MKRWFLRFALFSAAIWAFLAVASLYSVYLARGTPDWYPALPTATAAEQLIEANISEQKVADLFSYAGDVAAAQRRRYLARMANPNAVIPPADIIGPKTVHFSEPEINAFAVKWQAAISAGGAGSFGGRGAEIGRYVRDARVALADGGLLIAARLQEMGVLSNTIASVEFRPELAADSRLSPNLYRVFSGRLPVPSAIWSNPRAKLATNLQYELQNWRLLSGVRADGLANHYAAATAAGRILLAALNGQSVEPIILLPCTVGDLRSSVPLDVTELTIAGQKLTASFRPLTDDELSNLPAMLGNP
jgi:hypothetical protein